MHSRAVIGGLLLLLTVVPGLHTAESRQLVTLHSGFQLEADYAEIRDGQLILHINGGEIQMALQEVSTMDSIVPGSQPATPSAKPEDSSPQMAPVPVQELIRSAAERQGLPEAFVRSVAEAESALRPDAVSSKGARGVMQLMPGTALELGVDPDDPAENIEGGARLLRTLLLRYQNEPDQLRRALAAYNAGAGAVEKYRGVPPYQETQRYIQRVLRRYYAYSSDAGSR